MKKKPEEPSKRLPTPAGLPPPRGIGGANQLPKPAGLPPPSGDVVLALVDKDDNERSSSRIRI